MLKFISSHFYRPLIIWYLRNERSYRYNGISVKVQPGVFHPGFFFSTKFLLQHLDTLDLRNKSLLELGAGSGLISFYAEKQGAVVTATDLSEKAVENVTRNKRSLHSNVTIIKSDLFDHVPAEKFDIIVINPPYYPKRPLNESQLAWYCGEDFEYFKKLFSTMGKFMHEKTRTILVLSEDCNIQRIKSIAEENEFKLELSTQKRFWWEWNYIFDIVKTFSIGCRKNEPPLA